MRHTPRESSAESFWMLFAIWGLGLAGMPADFDEAEPSAAAQQVQSTAAATPSQIH